MYKSPSFSDKNSCRFINILVEGGNEFMCTNLSPNFDIKGFTWTVLFTHICVQHSVKVTGICIRV